MLSNIGRTEVAANWKNGKMPEDQMSRSRRSPSGCCELWYQHVDLPLSSQRYAHRHQELVDELQTAVRGSDTVLDALQRPVCEVFQCTQVEVFAVSTVSTIEDETHLEQPRQKRDEICPFVDTLKGLQTLVD